MIEYRVFSLYAMERKIDMQLFKRKIYDFILEFDLPKPDSLMNIITVINESDDYYKLKRLADKAEKYGIIIQEHTYKLQYNKNDIDNARFFEMKLGIYGKADHTESYQTEVKDFYCESCDTHQLIPENDVYINKAEFRGKDIATSMKYNTEIIVSDKFKNLIENAGLTGADFYPAHHYNKCLKNDYLAWHMVVRNIMPSIHSSMPVNILEGYCSVCKRHHILPLSYVRYKINEIEEASDFNLSAENFGAGWYGSPKLIVSKKVYDLIKNNTIKGCKFEIVGIV